MLKLEELLNSIILTVVTPIEGSLGSRLRYLYYRWQLKHCGGYFVTGAGFRLMGCSNISIGRRCLFNNHVWIGASCGIEIGDDVLVGPYVVMRDANHGYADKTKRIREQDNSKAKITIGDDVWIGAMVVILKGVTVGRGSIVAAHSLVNKDIGENTIWGGVPARFLKER